MALKIRFCLFNLLDIMLTLLQNNDAEIVIKREHQSLA